MIGLPVLDKLSRDSRIEFCGVATQIDRPAGRKKLLTPTPVGAMAAERNMKLRKCPDVNDTEFLDYLRTLNLDFLVVVSFGQILRQELLDLPGISCVNIHASLLPKYRGASPISSAILNRERETGITIMKMARGLDTGGIYCAFRRPLNGTERADELEKELGELAAENIIRALSGIADGELSADPQDENLASRCSKVRKHDGLIDWRRPAAAVDAKVRAFLPWPGAYFMLKAGNAEPYSVTITAARAVQETAPGGYRPGTVLVGKNRTLNVVCGGDMLEILKLAPAGKREMSAKDFLNGIRDAVLEIV